MSPMLSELLVARLRELRLNAVHLETERFAAEIMTVALARVTSDSLWVTGTVLADDRCSLVRFDSMTRGS